MILEILILIMGLFASYLLIKSVYPGQQMIKLTVSTITLFVSQLILFGYYLNYLGAPLFSVYTLILFSLVAAVILLNYRQLLHPDIDIDRTFTLGFIFIIIIGFIAYIFPALPSFFPVSRNADSAAHFEMLSYIVETNALPNSINEYPTGMHMMIAFATKLLNIDPIQIIYPFIVIITVLTAGIIYGFVIESEISGKLFGLIPAVIILSFFMTLYMTMVMGWWAMIFGIYLVLTFIWLLMDYIKAPSIPKLLPLIIIEVAIIFSYNFWAPIPALTLFIALATNSNATKKVAGIHFTLFIFMGGALTIQYLSLLGTALGEINNSNTGPSVSFLPFGFFNWRVTPEKAPLLINTINYFLTVYFAIGIIGGMRYIKNKKFEILTAFIIAAFLQTFALGIAALYFGFDLYLYAKAYNLLLYPVTVFLWITVKDILLKWNILNEVKDSTGFKPTFLIILSFIILLSSYTMTLGIKSTGHQVLAITPDQYDVSLWARNNLGGENLTSLSEWPQGLWFSVISKRNFTSVDEKYGVNNASVIKSKFDRWELTSKKGDIMAMLDISKIDVHLEAYTILYRKGNAVILKKDGTI